MIIKGRFADIKTEMIECDISKCNKSGKLSQNINMIQSV